MNEHVTMASVYAGACATAVYLFLRAPDRAQRIAMLLLMFGFGTMAFTMVAAALNGRGPEWQELLRIVRDAGREHMQTGLFVMLLRLAWKEWVFAPVVPHACQDKPLTPGEVLAGGIIALVLVFPTGQAIAADPAEVVSLVGVAEKMSVVAVLVVGLYVAWLEIKRGRAQAHDMRNKLVNCHSAREMWKTGFTMAKAACDHAAIKLDGFSMADMQAREERLLREEKTT